MKTIKIEGRRQLKIIDVPIPRAFDNFVVVKIRSAPMCTEYRNYDKDDTCINMGHEAAGDVIETASATRVKKGDKVIVMPGYSCGQCDLCLSGNYIHCENASDPLKLSGIEYGTGAFAEYILKPDWLLLPIPEDISYDEASMACCGLGPAFEATKMMNTGPEDTVLITGLGPVGLGAIICCAAKGSRVIGVSHNQYRRSLAQQLGAAIVLEPNSPLINEKILELTNGRGVDKVIECSGNTIHQQLAIRSVKRKGHIAFIGESSAFTFNVSKDLLRKGLTLYGIWHWNINHYQEMIQLIRASKEKIHQLITHIFPIDAVEDAFQLQLTANCGKIILRP